MSLAEQVNPTDQWFDEMPGGHIALRNPFDRIPVRFVDFSQEPTLPPIQFHEDPALRKGFDAWKHPDARNIEMTVFLTDPADPNGLGDLNEFWEFANNSDMVGISFTRSVQRTLRQHGLAAHKGNVRLGDAQPHPEFERNLNEVIGATPATLFTIDPAIGPDALVPNAVEALQKMRDQVYDLATEHDIENPDGQLVGADIIHMDNLQWAQVSIGGLIVPKLCDEKFFGALPDRLLWVMPAEQSDYARKIQETGRQNIQVVAGTESLKNQPDYREYGDVMRNGYIPAEGFAD